MATWEQYDPYDPRDLPPAPPLSDRPWDDSHADIRGDLQRAAEYAGQGGRTPYVYPSGWDLAVLAEADVHEARARDRRRHLVLTIALLAAFLLGMLCPYVWVHA